MWQSASRSRDQSLLKKCLRRDLLTRAVGAIKRFKIDCARLYCGRIDSAGAIFTISAALREFLQHVPNFRSDAVPRAGILPLLASPRGLPTLAATADSFRVFARCF